MSPKVTKRRVLGSIGILGTLGCVGAIGSDTDPESGGTQSTGNGNGDGNNGDTEEVHSVGQTFTVGEGDHKVEYTVNEVQVRQEVGGEYTSEEASGEFVVVNMTLTNVGSESFRVHSGLFTLVDSEDREYDVDDESQFMMENPLAFEQLHPDLSEEGDVVFDVPPDQSERRLQLKPAGTFSLASEHYVELD